VEKRLVVCSAYLPYDSEDPHPSRELEELVRYCESERIQLRVGCDSNAHHIAWGSTNCNGTGEALIEFLNSTNLEIFNRGNEPTIFTSVRQEVIDITLGFMDFWIALLIGRSPWSPLCQIIDIFCSLYGAPCRYS
jgi:hypothetical protein